ncbi:MAG: hypothetical protein WBD53_04110 [Xanthobacteraceae bacterium]
MALDPDENADLASARTVRLAGHDLHVAPLSLRQILAIADYVPKLSALGADDLSGERLMPLAEVLWHGLRRAHPKLTREEFFDLPITIAELVAALPVVIEQAGGKKVDAAPGESEPHRAGAMGTSTGAASALTPSIGAGSSPSS